MASVSVHSVIEKTNWPVTGSLSVGGDRKSGCHLCCVAFSIVPEYWEPETGFLSIDVQFKSVVKFA